MPKEATHFRAYLRPKRLEDWIQCSRWNPFYSTAILTPWDAWTERWVVWFVSIQSINIFELEKVQFSRAVDIALNYLALTVFQYHVLPVLKYLMLRTIYVFGKAKLSTSSCCGLSKNTRKKQNPIIRLVMEKNINQIRWRKNDWWFSFSWMHINY